MTWKSHCVANGALALALTCRLDVALAAMATAALPDQIEMALPLGRHRGASHWVLLWLVVIVAGPVCVRHEWARGMAALPWRHARGVREIRFALEMAGIRARARSALARLAGRLLFRRRARGSFQPDPASSCRFTKRAPARSPPGTSANWVFSGGAARRLRAVLESPGDSRSCHPWHFTAGWALAMRISLHTA